MSDLEHNPRTKASFRIWGPSLNPDDITQQLHLLPDYTHLQGDYPQGNPKHTAYKHGMWSLHSKAPPQEELDVHLQNLLSTLEPHAEVIRILSSQAQVDFYCGIFGLPGFNVSPQTMARMSALNIRFSVCFYP